MAIYLKLCPLYTGYHFVPTIKAIWSRVGVLPCKGFMGTCGQPGYVFRDFCLKQGIDLIIFCLNQGIDFINFCLKQGISSWTINSLRVCSTNVLTGSGYEGPGRASPPKDISCTSPPGIRYSMNSYPICDVPLWRSAQCSFAP